MPISIRLRPVRPEDFDTHFEHQRDEASYRMAGVAPRDREAFDAHWKKVLPVPTNLFFTIEADGEIAGNVVSWLADGHRLLGYWVGREYWGRGIASAAVAEFLVQVPERPIVAHVAKHNAGSRRVLEKNGFVEVDEGLVTELGGDPVEESVFRLG